MLTTRMLNSFLNCPNSSKNLAQDPQGHTVCDNITLSFRLNGKVESFKRMIRFVCLFNCLLAERRKNDCIVNKWSCGLHIRLGAPYTLSFGEDSLFLPFTSGKRCIERKRVTATAQRNSCNRARRSSQKGANRSSFYSATNRFVIVFPATNHFRTVRSFHLNGWGVSYNGKGRSVFVLFRKNGTITLYCPIPYIVTREGVCVCVCCCSLFAFGASPVVPSVCSPPVPSSDVVPVDAD